MKEGTRVRITSCCGNSKDYPAGEIGTIVPPPRYDKHGRFTYVLLDTKRYIPGVVNGFESIGCEAYELEKIK